MSLARTNSPLNKLIIRNIGDVGGPRSDHVDAELDNIIAWAKLSPRCIHRNTASVGNVGAGADVLHSFTLPGGSLATNGDYLHVEYQGQAVNTNAFTITVQFDGVSVHSPGSVTANAGARWTYGITYIRLTSTTIRCKVWATDLNTTPAFNVVDQSDITVGDLASNRVMQVLGEVTTTPADNEVTQNLSIIELCQQ